MKNEVVFSLGGLTEPQALIRRVYETKLRFEQEPASQIQSDMQSLVSDLCAELLRTQLERDHLIEGRL